MKKTSPLCSTCQKHNGEASIIPLTTSRRKRRRSGWCRFRPAASYSPMMSSGTANSGMIPSRKTNRRKASSPSMTWWSTTPVSSPSFSPSATASTLSANYYSHQMRNAGPQSLFRPYDLDEILPLPILVPHTV